MGEETHDDAASEAAVLVPIARIYATAWFLCGFVVFGRAAIMAPICVTLAIIGHGRSQRTISDSSFRLRVALLTIAWIAAGATIMLEVAYDDVVWSVLAGATVGAIGVFGMHSLSLTVDRTNPPAGVKRWTRIGLAGAVAAFVVFTISGAFADAADTLDTATPWLGAAGVAAFVATALGYGSAIGQLMRTARHPLAPRQLDADPDAP